MLLLWLTYTSLRTLIYYIDIFIFFSCFFVVGVSLSVPHSLQSSVASSRWTYLGFSYSNKVKLVFNVRTHKNRSLNDLLIQIGEQPEMVACTFVTRFQVVDGRKLSSLPETTIQRRSHHLIYLVPCSSWFRSFTHSLDSFSFSLFLTLPHRCPKWNYTTQLRLFNGQRSCLKRLAICLIYQHKFCVSSFCNEVRTRWQIKFLELT